jgi:hypothetical protein
MPFIRRNAAGEIVAVSHSAGEGCTEEIAAGDRRLAGFLESLRAGTTALQGSDQGFIRVLEDLVDLLVEKQVIAFEELPEDAREKISRRKQLRRQLRDRAAGG